MEKIKEDRVPEERAKEIRQLALEVEKSLKESKKTFQKEDNDRDLLKAIW